MKEYLTDAGRDMLAGMLAGEYTIRYTKVEMGDGALSTSQHYKKMTALVNTIASLDVDSVVVTPDNIVKIAAVFSNKELTSGFYYREKGIFATDGKNEVLFAYANSGSDAEWIEPPTIELVEKKIVSLYKEYQDTETELKIEVKSGVYLYVDDAANIYATKDEMEGKVPKEDGKGLSECNYTSAEKEKLKNIADGANETVIDSSLSEKSENPPMNKIVTQALNNRYTKDETNAKLNDLANADIIKIYDKGTSGYGITNAGTSTNNAEIGTDYFRLKCQDANKLGMIQFTKAIDCRQSSRLLYNISSYNSGKCDFAQIWIGTSAGAKDLMTFDIPLATGLNNFVLPDSVKTKSGVYISFAVSVAAGNTANIQFNQVYLDSKYQSYYDKSMKINDLYTLYYYNYLMAGLGKLFVKSTSKNDKITSKGRYTNRASDDPALMYKVKCITSSGYWTGFGIMSTTKKGIMNGDDVSSYGGINTSSDPVRTPNGNTVYIGYMGSAWTNQNPDCVVNLSSGDTVTITEPVYLYGGAQNKDKFNKFLLSVADYLLFDDNDALPANPVLDLLELTQDGELKLKKSVLAPLIASNNLAVVSTGLLSIYNYLDYGLKFTYFTNPQLQILPTKDNITNLGHSSYRFAEFRCNNIYISSGTAVTSDRRYKDDIKELNDELTFKFIMSLIASSYKYKDGESGRTHYGLIAQDVEKIMTELGMTMQDFAGVVIEKLTKEVEVETVNDDGETVIEKRLEETGEIKYDLRYEEFIAPLIKVVQMQQAKIDSIEERLSNLEEKLNR